jgi:hypothetical protein
VLTEKPVAEFMLPDGSVLKNAFVWRRNSEGMMIVHDDGQFFLNYRTMPDDWKAAYLGAPADTNAVQVIKEETVTEDTFRIRALLDAVPGLNEKGVTWLLREDADEESEKWALGIALFHRLACNDREKAKRYLYLIEEKGFEIDPVKLESIFSKCIRCNGKGEYEQPCPDCDGSGDCAVCDGTGLQKFTLGKSGQACEPCEGTGECPTCEGKKEAVLPCPKCQGRGQTLNLQYCKVNRDRLVRMVNIEVGDVEEGSLLNDERIGLEKVLKALPGLKEEALAYYLSPEYTGGADDLMLVAGTMRGLLRDKGQEAAYYNLMLQAYYPKNKLLTIEDYVRTCSDCKGKGGKEEQCPSCKRGKAKGKCVECEGTGKGASELRSEKECEACEGSGECAVCKGDGKALLRCTTCNGRGRVFEEMRTEIKLEITVDALNKYHRTYLKALEEAEAGATNLTETVGH